MLGDDMNQINTNKKQTHPKSRQQHSGNQRHSVASTGIKSSPSTTSLFTMGSQMVSFNSVKLIIGRDCIDLPENLSLGMPTESQYAPSVLSAGVSKAGQKINGELLMA